MEGKPHSSENINQKKQTNYNKIWKFLHADVSYIGYVVNWLNCVETQSFDITE